MIDSAKVFLDTTVLIYAALGSVDEPKKHARALELLVEDFGTSGQVLAEFYYNATCKGAPPLEPAVAREWVNNLAKKPFQPIDVATIRAGTHHAQHFQISYWDGAIIAAAERLGATTVYSEDLPPGQHYGSVEVVNPFQ